MSTYFTYFPTTPYNGVEVREITRRTNFVTNLLSNPYVFLPYTIKESEKPEDIAYNYYGTVAATWVVLLANNIIDPYTQWPMDQDKFTDYLVEKYREQSGMVGYDVVAWTQNSDLIDNILYYYTTGSNDQLVKASPLTFPMLYDQQGNVVGRDVPVNWKPERIYDYENTLNEQNREILIVEKRYYEQIQSEFKRIIKQ